jgi:hypothetical protein
LVPLRAAKIEADGAAIPNPAHGRLGRFFSKETCVKNRLMIAAALVMLAACGGSPPGDSANTSSTGPTTFATGGALQASLTLKDGAVVQTPFNDTAWSIAKSGVYDADGGTVTYAVSVTRGQTSATALAATGYLSITNNGGAPATIGNIVVNLQRQQLYKGKSTWVSAAADVANAANGDAATVGNIVASSSAENAAANAAVGAGNYTTSSPRGTFTETAGSGSLEFTDAGNNTAFSISPQISIPAATTVNLLFTANFNLDVPAGTLLRAEVLVTFGNSGARGGSGASAQNIDVNGNGSIDGDEANVRTVPIRITQALGGLQAGNDSVTLTDLCDTLAVTGPATFASCATGIGEGAGSEVLSGTAVRTVTYSGVTAGTTDGLWINCANITGQGVTVVVNGPVDPLTSLPIYSYTFDLVDAVNADACASVTVPGVEPPPPVNPQPTTYTQGGWGAQPNGNNPGALLAANFSQVYPSGVEVGIPGAGGFSMTFSSASAVNSYLPAGGKAGALTADLANPTSSSSGVFGGQVLALQLNVDFSSAGVTLATLAGAVYAESGMCMDGATVAQILAAANTALGGSSVTGCTISDLNGLATNLNEAFDNGVLSGWGLIHLTW